jgi:hypothetical protein
MRQAHAVHARPASDTDTPFANPYHCLVAAILERAVQDALGHTIARGDADPRRTQSEARAWLLAERGVADLIALAGFDPDVVLRRVRRVLDG